MYCKRYGHFQKVCRSCKANNASVNESDAELNDNESSDEEIEDGDLYVGEISMTEVNNNGLGHQRLMMQNELVNFKLDTGPQANIIPRYIYITNLKMWSFTHPNALS